MARIRKVAAALAGVLLAGRAAGLPAAELRAVVLMPDGAPVADAVVTLAPLGHVLEARPVTSAPVIRQRGERFEPFVLAVPVGSAVRFPNDDPYRHHVFSFSRVKPFEIRLYGKDQVPEVVFDKPGAVALGCNIHDEMRGYVYVVAEPLFGSTGPDGQLLLAGVPPGRYQATVWHPGLKSRDNLPHRQEVTVAADSPATGLRFQVAVGRPTRPAPPDRERASY